MEYKGVFISGTDTGVGKTLITGFLARYFNDKGRDIVTQKWIQTGCVKVSEDVKEHIKLSGIKFSCEGRTAGNISPYILSYPASPHLASRVDNVAIDKIKIMGSFNELVDIYDLVIVEGSGGVLVPFNEREYLIDIVKEISLPVIIVAENRLGTINHTLLSVEAVRNRGVEILGIVFNNLSPGTDLLVAEDNLKIIESLSSVPVLGELSYHKDINCAYDDFLKIGERINKCMI